MPQYWIDQKSYVGPCRRCGPDGLRWAERRRKNMGGDPPSLPSLLRRLRIQAFDLSTEEMRVGFLTHLHAATALAETLHAHECGERLVELAKLTVCGGSELEVALAGGLTEALDLASGRSLNAPDR